MSSSTGSEDQNTGSTSSSNVASSSSVLNFSDYFTFDSNTDLIGIGSTCSVYRCFLRPEMENNHPFGQLPTHLCVKVYSHDILRTNPDFISKVIDRENSALANHVHPNIVRMVHTFREQDPSSSDPKDYRNVYVVQELAPGTRDDMSALEGLSVEERKKAMQQLGGGPELYRYFATRNLLGEDVVRYIMVQLFSPVMALHRLDPPIVHRDLKPENAVVCGEKTLPNGKKVPIVKLMDFGLSRTLPIDKYVTHINTMSTNNANSRFEWMTAYAGSAAFMAPEVTNATSSNLAKYGISYDIFSLGMTLFVLSTKKFPKDDGAIKLLHQQVSPQGIDLLTRLLSDHPSHRPSARAALCHPWFDPIRTEYTQIFGDNILEQVKAEQDERSGHH